MILQWYEDEGGVCIVKESGAARRFSPGDTYIRLRRNGRHKVCVIRRRGRRILWICCDDREALKEVHAWLAGGP